DCFFISKLEVFDILLEKNRLIMKKQKPNVLQIKFMMRGISPTVWRKLQITEDSSFLDLHNVFQDSMGWSGRHLFEFRVNHPKEKELLLLSKIHNFGEDNPLAQDVLVKDIFTKKGQRGHYVYDLESNWLFEMKFEGAVPMRPRTQFPLCHSGSRFAPPEDIGGIWSFEHYRDCLFDRQHEEHLIMLEHFYGGDFDMREYPTILAKAHESLTQCRIDVSLLKIRSREDAKVIVPAVQ
ncbi:MAG TPA: hypothetical protein DHV51_02450, partial [Opitutae bacterium]|nr:hypothetical protein [Opitutae bacterium]